MLGPLTLTKEERISSKKLLEQLFDKAARRSVVAYPLRAVYLVRSDDTADVPVQMMVSVPKRLLRHAVDRNRVKRQVREAYRKNKYSLADAVGRVPGRKLAVGFVWLDNRVCESAVVERSVRSLIGKIGGAI